MSPRLAKPITKRGISIKGIRHINKHIFTKQKMITTLEKTDSELKADVLAELRYEPKVNVTDIGVLVKDGTVTLNGYASSYAEKWNAVHATKRIAGVVAIADDIEVKLPASHIRTDGELAAAAANQINWSMTIPKGTVEVTVSKGRVILEGQQEWWSQKIDAENAVHQLTGVKAVTNLITIKPKVAATDVETAIRSAFERHALLDANNVHVASAGGKITLSGCVPHYIERDEAERVAWAAPGVASVDNQITVSWL